jgi:hypothetical protein
VLRRAEVEARAEQREVDREQASGPLSPVLVRWRFSRRVWCVNNMRVCMRMGEAPPLLVEEDGGPELEGRRERKVTKLNDGIGPAMVRD